MCLYEWRTCVFNLSVDIWFSVCMWYFRPKGVHLELILRGVLCPEIYGVNVSHLFQKWEEHVRLGAFKRGPLADRKWGYDNFIDTKRMNDVGFLEELRWHVTTFNMNFS